VPLTEATLQNDEQKLASTSAGSPDQCDAEYVGLMGHFQQDSSQRRLTVPRDGFLERSRVLQKTCVKLLWAGSETNFRAVPKWVDFCVAPQTSEF
jgi:hypothetical protein